MNQLKLNFQNISRYKSNKKKYTCKNVHMGSKAEDIKANLMDSWWLILINTDGEMNAFIEYIQKEKIQKAVPCRIIAYQHFKSQLHDIWSELHW